MFPIHTSDILNSMTRLVINDYVVGVIVFVSNNAHVEIGRPFQAHNHLDVLRFGQVSSHISRGDTNVVLGVNEQIVVVNSAVEQIPMTVHQMEFQGGRLKHNRQGKNATTRGENPIVQQIYQCNGIRDCCVDDDVYPGGTTYAQILIGIQCFFKMGYLTKVLKFFPAKTMQERKTN
jgi:hypothetical protein